MEAKMGKGSFSRQPQRENTMKSSQSGIVIDDATETSYDTISCASGNFEEPQILKKDACLYLPIANVTRIMHNILPPTAKIADEAKETVQVCVSEFISFVTTVANEKCHQECRKTITPQDVLAAIADLGFDKYVEPLTAYYDQIHNQESKCSNPKQQRYHARCETNLVQSKKQALVAQKPPTNYASPHGMYKGDTSVGMSQMNNSYVNKAGRRHGEGSSNKFVFDPYN